MGRLHHLLVGIFVCATMANELIRLAGSSQSEDSAPAALFMVIRRNLRRYGGMLIHFGAVLIFLGVLEVFASRDLTLTKDQAQTIGSYQLVFGASEIRENAIHRAAKEAGLGRKRLQFLNPAKAFTRLAATFDRGRHEDLLGRSLPDLLFEKWGIRRL